MFSGFCCHATFINSHALYVQLHTTTNFYGIRCQSSMSTPISVPSYLSIHNFYGRFIHTKLRMAKLSTSVRGNNNTRYTNVEVHTKVSTQEYSSCKQYDRKFGDHSKTSFNFVTSRSKQNPHTRNHTNKCTHKQERYKNEICTPEKYFLRNTRHCFF
jgi:hypothetical protein